MRPLRIALLAPPWEAVPPPRYGGTELVVANLAEAFVARGHRVTLFASGDSRTRARLVAPFPRGLYRMGIPWGDTPRPLEHIFQCFRHAERFDLIHNHAGPFGLVFSRLVATPVVTTVHADLSALHNRPAERRLWQAFPASPVVAISRAQRQFAPSFMRVVGTVHNGIAVPRFTFRHETGRYLAWLGRITEKKGILEAIAVAKRSRLPLRIGAKIDRVDEPFWLRRVKPLVDGRRIRYLGELTHRQKVALLANARALLYPIRWEEPFGLVMIEAMACGTPVIAFDRGSVREIIKDGVTGVVVKAISDMARAVRRVGTIDRRACRAWVEQKFTVEKMVEGYEEIYHQILPGQRQR